MADLVFNKYEIQTRLAVGGMGEVFFAVQKGEVAGFERPVILKSLLPDLAAQENFIEQFLDEARVAATLNHPNVVSIFEVGLWEGVYFIAMEYISGRNLSQLLKMSRERKLPVPPVVIARILHDAALGLHHAHTAVDANGEPLHIVHRDVSPQNVMVRDDGVTKVVDFGIATGSNRAATRTATGTFKGKLSYMAPEQLRGARVTSAADQYALGVVLWELACGQRLFRAAQEVDLIRQVLEGKISPPSETVPGLPSELDVITMRMLDHQPSHRYPSCEDVAKAFDQFVIAQSGGGWEGIAGRGLSQASRPTSEAGLSSRYPFAPEQLRHLARRRVPTISRREARCPRRSPERAPGDNGWHIPTRDENQDLIFAPSAPPQAANDGARLERCRSRFGAGSRTLRPVPEHHTHEEGPPGRHRAQGTRPSALPPAEARTSRG